MFFRNTSFVGAKSRHSTGMTIGHACLRMEKLEFSEHCIFPIQETRILNQQIRQEHWLWRIFPNGQKPDLQLDGFNALQEPRHSAACLLALCKFFDSFNCLNTAKCERGRGNCGQLSRCELR